MQTGAVQFFTETLPTKWTEFWAGVGNFFTETIPAWIENSVTGAKTFFTETLPEKWNSFWGGIGDKISGFFGGVWDTVKGAFGAGYNDATATATPHAWGGIMTKPHMGIVAEAGAESIIPLSPSKRGRGIDLWEQTGQALGVRPYAEGGIVGETDEADIPLAPGGDSGPKINIHLAMSPQFVIEAQESGMDEESIIAIIKAHIKEMVDEGAMREGRKKDRAAPKPDKQRGAWIITPKGGGENAEGQQGRAEDRRAGRPENGQAPGGSCRGIYQD